MVLSQMRGSEVSTSVVKRNEDLSNSVSIIIISCTDHMKFSAYMAFSFITFFHIVVSIFYHCIVYGLCFVFIY
jgi:hypothetical protein